jgi:hypothetical protein
MKKDISAQNRFINEQNQKRYRELLVTVTDKEQRKQIKYLLAEEEDKIRPFEAS